MFGPREPGASARRVRQRNQLEVVPLVRDLEAPADPLGERRGGEEELLGVLADRDHRGRPEDLELVIQVRPAALDLVGRRRAVAPLAVPARKAADRSGHPDPAAEGFFRDFEAGDPGEELGAGGVGEEAAPILLARARRLPDQQDARGTLGDDNDRRARDRGAAPAARETRRVTGELATQTAGGAGGGAGGGGGGRTSTAGSHQPASASNGRPS